MSRTGHHILLIALFLMLTVMPLQAWSVSVAGAADSHCMMHQDSAVKLTESLAQGGSITCQHCQDSNCDSNECNMPSCLTHQGQAFTVVFNNLSTSGLGSGAILLQPESKIRSRNDPPLIRPPITLDS